LAHYCAVGLRQINVVASGDKAKLESQDLRRFKSTDDVFLNNETGDFFNLH